MSSNPPSFSKQRYCSLTYFLLDSTNAAVSLYKMLTFLVDVDVPLPLQSSQRSVNEQLSESGVLQRCTKRREGRKGRGWKERGGEREEGRRGEGRGEEGRRGEKRGQLYHIPCSNPKVYPTFPTPSSNPLSHSAYILSLLKGAGVEDDIIHHATPLLCREEQ